MSSQDDNDSSTWQGILLTLYRACFSPSTVIPLGSFQTKDTHNI